MLFCLGARSKGLAPFIIKTSHDGIDREGVCIDICCTRNPLGAYQYKGDPIANCS